MPNVTAIELRNDLAANWASTNPTPATGEPCVETDTGVLKIGGTLAYNSLPVLVAPPKFIFSMNSYGADATGVASSDTAFVDAYDAAVAAIQTSGGAGGAGAGLTCGAGQYQLNVNIFEILHPNISFKATGKKVTEFFTTGSNGDCLYFGNNVTAGATGAPISGFEVNCGGAGVDVNGVHFGDRNGCSMTDVSVVGCSATGSRGFFFQNELAGSNPYVAEEGFFELYANTNYVNYSFDGTSVADAGSFDYGAFFLTSINPVSAAVQVVNGAHIFGAKIFSVAGNISGATAAATGLVIGTNTSDTAKITGGANFQWSMECDSSTHACYDMDISGTGFGAGLYQVHGNFYSLAAGGTWSFGSFNYQVLIEIAGYLQSPAFAAANGMYSVLSNSLMMFSNSQSQPMPFFGITGAPTFTAVEYSYAFATTGIYRNTSSGSGSTWTSLTS